jgi:ABC-type branched-subunit amino acid transport system permease subunit
MEFLIHIIILCCLYAIVVVSLNLISGFGGMFNMAPVAFFGIGAYTSVILTESGVPFFIAFFTAGIFSLILGVFLAWSCNKLKDDYFSVATLAFSLMIFSLFKNLVSVTKGNIGIVSLVDPGIGAWRLNTDLGYMILVLIVAGISIWLIHRLVSSPFGRTLEALRDNELNLAVLGKNTLKIKMQIMSFSAVFMGISGSLYGHYIDYVHPRSFYWDDLILIITIMMLGGLASIKGSVIATFIVIILSEAIIRFLPFPVDIIGPARQLFYLTVLLIILFYRPKGLFGKLRL